MHRLGTGVLARLQDPISEQIALGARRRPDVDRLVGHLDMQCSTIRVGVNGDGLDAHAGSGLEHTAGDLASIRDK
jgi:hypothetical protein